MEFEAVDNLGVEFMLTVASSTGNLRYDVGKWVTQYYPSANKSDSELRNQERFLYRIASQTRPLMRMAEFGLGAKLFATLSISYFDTAVRSGRGAKRRDEILAFLTRFARRRRTSWSPWRTAI